MPIPSVIGDLSTTASLNSPSGSENVSTTDDYLRSIQGIIKTVYDAQAVVNSGLPTTYLQLAGGSLTGLLNVNDGADIASASTVNLTTATGNTVRITGTTPITAFTMNAGQQMELIAVGALPLTYNATTMNINGGASYTCAAGDRLSVFKDGAGVIQVNVTKQDGTSIASSRRLAQIVTFQTGAVATGTTIIPHDNTIPQITEGDQYMSLAITPTNASSTLEITVTALFATSVNNYLTAALFQDSTANALAAVCPTPPVANYATTYTFKHIMTSGTTSTTTFKLRAGGPGASTTTFNGEASAQLMGGSMASRITIKEYLP